MAYHIFHTADDFWKAVAHYKSLGYSWIQDSHFWDPVFSNSMDNYNPKVTDSNMPVILNADENKTMMFGLMSRYKYRYMSDPKFVELYNKSLRDFRKRKLEKINKK